MDKVIVDFTLVTFIREMRKSLDEAAIIAKAAKAFADAGDAPRGVAVSLDIEQLLYEATNLLNTASLINRLAKER